MVKTKIFRIENLLVSVKAICNSVVSGLITCLFMLLGFWLVNNNFAIVGRLVQVLTAFLYIFLWGYFANKFWRWK